MQEQAQDPLTLLKTLRFIFGALLSGQVIYLAVALVIGTNKPANPSAIWSIIVPAFALAQIGASFAIRAVLRSKVAGIDSADIPKRSAAIMTAHLVPWACLEGASLFALTIFLVTGTAWPGLVIGGGLIACFASTAPSKAVLVALYQA